MATVNVNVDIDLSELEDDIQEEYCNKCNCLCPDLWKDYKEEIENLISEIENLISELENELYFYTTKSNITLEDVVKKLKYIIE